jgi:hypothetical protein
MPMPLSRIRSANEMTAGVHCGLWAVTRHAVIAPIAVMLTHGFVRLVQMKRASCDLKGVA